MRFRSMIFFLSLVTLLSLIPNLASAQYPPPLLTISPVQVQLGNLVTFQWVCPFQLLSWQYEPLPFIYAQITVNRVQEYPRSIPPYITAPLTGAGTLSYAPRTNGTFTVILRCHYLGWPIGLGDFTCPSIECKSGGQFIVTPPTTVAST